MHEGRASVVISAYTVGSAPAGVWLFFEYLVPFCCLVQSSSAFARL